MKKMNRAISFVVVILLACASVFVAGAATTTTPQSTVVVPPSMIVKATYRHVAGGMGTPTEYATDLDIYYNGTPDTWVEFYVGNSFIKSGYTNPLTGNFSALCRASSNYPGVIPGIYDCLHEFNPHEYIVDAYEGNRPALTLNVYCPPPCGQN